MEFLPLLSVVRRRIFFVAGGALVAVALALAIGGPPPSSSALAWTRVALDTPVSQLVESAPAGAETLPWRASLLTHLMATDKTVRQIAARLGVRPDEVTVVDTALAEPEIRASMPSSAAEAAAATVAPYVLTVYVKTPDLPMISIEAAGPDRGGATRLAKAAVAVLKAQSSTAQMRFESPILTGGGRALKTQSYLVEQVAAIHSKPVTSATLPAKQIGVPFCLFALWCAGVMLLPPLLRRRSPRPATV